MYSIAYRKYGFPQVDLDFPTETAMFAYVNTWINGDEDYIEYFKNNEPYEPVWTR